MSENEFFGICIGACYVLYPMISLILTFMNKLDGCESNIRDEDDRECEAFAWIISPISVPIMGVTIVFRLIFGFFVALVTCLQKITNWMTGTKHRDI